MRIYLTAGNRVANTIGGGFTFNQNLKLALKDEVQWVDTIEQAEIFLISGLTLATKEEIRYAQENNIPIIFRIDNIPKPSRNRGLDVAGKLRHLGEIAEVNVYQSKWSRKLIREYSGDGEVIYNGVDTNLFRKDGEKLAKDSDKQIYLYVAHSSNVNKRFEEAQFIFSQTWSENKNCELWLVGRFEDNPYNFDFINGEKVRNFGVVEDRVQLAKIYRSADVLIYPAFADSCPNTVLEARASGLEIIGVNSEGGSIELLNPELDISLERMGREYLSLFKLVLYG